LVAELERRLHEDPWDPLLRSTLAQGQDLVSALIAPGRTHLGAHLGAPLAWDPWSVTVEARCLETGRAGLARLRRPSTAPWVGRLFDLARRALASLQPDLRADADGLVVLPPSPSRATALPLLLLGLASLERWIARGVVPAGPHWVVSSPEGARWIGVDARHVDPDSLRACLNTLVEATRAAGHLPDGVQDLISGWGVLPPDDLPSASEAALRALRRDLAERWLDLRDRSVHALVVARSRRLQGALQRLARALPIADGRAVLGVDANARPLLVHARRGVAQLTASGAAPEALGSTALDLQPTVARRLLRARATGTPSARLQAEAGGDAAWLEWVGRWTAATLRLKLLLDLSRTAEGP
jgi:hypothetical protein